jgi:hypothetical protein
VHGERLLSVLDLLLHERRVAGLLSFFKLLRVSDNLPAPSEAPTSEAALLVFSCGTLRARESVRSTCRPSAKCLAMCIFLNVP